MNEFVDIEEFKSKVFSQLDYFLIDKSNINEIKYLNHKDNLSELLIHRYLLSLNELYLFSPDDSYSLLKIDRRILYDYQLPVDYKDFNEGEKVPLFFMGEDRWRLSLTDFSYLHTRILKRFSRDLLNEPVAEEKPKSPNNSSKISPFVAARLIDRLKQTVASIEKMDGWRLSFKEKDVPKRSTYWIDELKKIKELSQNKFEEYFSQIKPLDGFKVGREPIGGIEKAYKELYPNGHKSVGDSWKKAVYSLEKKKDITISISTLKSRIKLG